MKIITPGHLYMLANFENKDVNEQFLQFIHKEVEEDTTEFITISDGTTNEEVIEVLIDRLNYLFEKFPSKETACAITKLEEALMWLNKRTQDRIKRNVEGKPLA